jgi:ankyrin repeat protein
MSPLMFAADKNNLDMVKVLLDAKAEVNVQNKVSESDGV